MGGLSDFQKRRIMRAFLAEAAVTLTTQLFRVLKTTVFMIMTVYAKHGKTMNKDCQTLRRIIQSTQNYCSKVTASGNIHHEDPVSTKTDHRELHKANIHKRAAIDPLQGLQLTHCREFD
uniref:Uncharacterized protein n=1 Tax=Sinocyclocheilus rhinocerous TaxID=307959 RepID=A0A673GGC2_9TELE